MIVNPLEKKVNERVVIITGASTGFGVVLCDSFRNAGYRVACCGRTIQPVEHSDTISVVADVRSSNQMQNLCDMVFDRWGRIDAVVANAGVGYEGMLNHCTVDQIDDAIETNITGTMNIMRHAARYMIDQHSGHLIAISSYIATHGSLGLSLYSASKAALAGLVRSFARELGTDGVQVNAVMPGFMDCGMGQRVSDNIKEKVLQKQLLHRFADPRESAEFIVHLAGMQQVSGQLFNLDSRITAWM